MARYAVWRRRLDDPQTIQGWLLGPSDLRSLPIEHRGRWFAWMGGATLFSLFASWAVGKPFMSLAFLGGATFFFSINRPEAKVHAEIPTLTEGASATPVTLTIFDATGRSTGKERGWVAFAEGWLVYEGLRTGFSLAQADVSKLECVLHVVTLILSDGRKIDLEVLTDGNRTHLPARHIDVPKLEKEVRTWRKGTTVEGEAVLPPSRIHPETAAKRLIFPASLALFALVLSAVAFGFGALVLAAPLLVVGIGSLVWWAVGLTGFRRDLPSLIK